MAEFSARRVVAVAAIAGALVGGMVAAMVAVASTSGTNSPALGGNTSVTTAAVVRTTLTTSVQEGGSIGYEGSYAIAIPSGTAQSAVNQDQEKLAADQQTLVDDQTSLANTEASNQEALTAAQYSVSTAQSVQSTGNLAMTNDQATLSAADQKESADCTGDAAASSSTCSSDEQAVASDQSKVQSDQTSVTADQTQVADNQAAVTATETKNQGTFEQAQEKVAADEQALTNDHATSSVDQGSASVGGQDSTYTELPSAGSVISRGQVLYATDDQPVTLLYGDIAPWRAFLSGMTPGPDVGELDANLAALGYEPTLAESDVFTAATAAGIDQLQTALGMVKTGELILGQVDFEPGPIRVTSVTPSVGSSVGGGGAVSGNGGGTVLTATSTTPIVTVDLDVSQEYLVKPGNAVSIVLPDGSSTVGGHIETVGSVATCPSGGGAGSGTGAQAGSSAASTATCSSSESGNSSTPTVPITITLDSIPELATLDEAPVNVDVTTQRASNVLAVPVNALLALQGGGFGVQVVSGTTTHLVGVTTGLYSDNLVQVSGSGISVGKRVQVPSSLP